MSEVRTLTEKPVSADSCPTSRVRSLIGLMIAAGNRLDKAHEAANENSKISAPMPAKRRNLTVCSAKLAYRTIVPIRSSFNQMGRVTVMCVVVA